MTGADVDLFGPLLLQCLTAATGACENRKRAFITVGEVALDDCCDGQVWARLIEVIPQQTDQRNGIAAAQACGVNLWDATIGIGSVICAHTVDDGGNAPAPSDLITETFDVAADMTQLMVAIQCELAPLRGERRVRFLRWVPMGPEGGCVGGEWQISVLVDNCACGDR